MSFLPHSLELNAFVVFGVLILLGMLGGMMAHKSMVFPRITAFMLVGLVFGPSGLGWVNDEMLSNGKVFIDIALGMIMFNLGRTLNLAALRRIPGIYAASAMEIALTFSFVAVGFMALGAHWLSALLVAAIGISASPAITMMVIQEFDAKGPVVTRTLPLLAFNNLGAFVVFTALLPLIYINEHTGAQAWMDIATMVLHPLYLLAGSFGLAYVIYVLGRLLLHPRLGATGLSPFPLLLGMLAFGIGFSALLELSAMLTSLLLGMMVANLKHTVALREESFGAQEEIFLIILFVIAGAKLHVAELGQYIGWALLFVALRTAGKLTALLACQPLTGTTWKQSVGITGMLTPMAGLAIGLTQMTESLFPTLGSGLATLILAGVAILETLGPVASEWALKWNKEIKKDSGVQH